MARKTVLAQLQSVLTQALAEETALTEDAHDLAFRADQLKQQSVGKLNEATKTGKIADALDALLNQQ